jgi:hypothetical protein
MNSRSTKASVDEAFDAGAIGGRELERADRWTLGRPFD